MKPVIWVLISREGTEAAIMPPLVGTQVFEFARAGVCPNWWERIGTPKESPSFRFHGNAGELIVYQEFTYS